MDFGNISLHPRTCQRGWDRVNEPFWFSKQNRTDVRQYVYAVVKLWNTINTDMITTLWHSSWPLLFISLITLMPEGEFVASIQSNKSWGILHLKYFWCDYFLGNHSWNPVISTVSKACLCLSSSDTSSTTCWSDEVEARSKVICFVDIIMVAFWLTP